MSLALWRGQQQHLQLVRFAHDHRMSTEDRKNVFCIIMSAEDYLDAFEKLLHLGIKDHKVIVSVLLHCCLSEKTYNPYYSTLAQKFCDFDRKYQLGFQYSSWDRIKDIESLKQFQLTWAMNVNVIYGSIRLKLR